VAPWRGLALVATLALSGCANVPSRPVPEADATPQEGYGRAIGRIIVSEDGKEVAMGPGFTSSNLLTLYLRSARTGELAYLELQSSGHFVLPLKPGGYVLLGYRWRRPDIAVQRTSTVRVMATFTVPQAGQAIYLGELQVATGREGSRFRVVDKFGEDGLSWFQSRPDAAKFQVAKGLMVLEAPVGKYKSVSRICSGNWGIACTKEFQGVEPLAPEGAAHGFPIVATLAPLLAWKPSGRADVTYDVAVYESHPLVPMAMASSRAQCFRGAVVAYAEGLAEPRFVPPGLARDKLYEWSVRLREGDIVSTWSTTSHDIFIIVAASRGWGEYFGFGTPK
jgi:hypothetical protein